MCHRPIFCVTAVFVFVSLAVDAADSPYTPGAGLYPRFGAKEAEPGLTFGDPVGVTWSKTLLYAVTPDELEADLDAWLAEGYRGFFLVGVAPEWTADVWAADGAPWTIGESDATLQQVRRVTARCVAAGAEVFLTTAFHHPFEWFNDVAWGQIEHRFRQMAVFARESGCEGLAIDIEYVHQQYHYSWEGYDFSAYSRRDVAEKIRERMMRVAETMYDEFPGMTLLTLPESVLSLGSLIQCAWIEVAAKRNAPGGVHLCTEFTYRRPNPRYMLAQAWPNDFVMRQLLSHRADAYWRERCSIAAGLWPLGHDPDDYHGDEPTEETFRQAFASSLMVGRRYNWIYSHNCRPVFLGRETDTYPLNDKTRAFREIIRKREIILNQEFYEAAMWIHAMFFDGLDEFLGLTLIPTFAGPREEVELNLIPVSVYAPTAQFALKPALMNLGFRLHRGEEIDLCALLNTQTEWMLIGPFDNPSGPEFDPVFPPESGIDLDAAYDTPHGLAKWRLYTAPPMRASINLAEIFQPSESVCAYALCFVETPARTDAQIRIGANDSWKLWVDGECAAAYPHDGRVILDREIVPVTLKQGVTPILLKVCNNKKDWGFILRITDASGAAIENLRVSARPQ